jgi:hypothetical protein
MADASLKEEPDWKRWRQFEEYERDKFGPYKDKEWYHRLDPDLKVYSNLL